MLQHKLPSILAHVPLDVECISSHLTIYIPMYIAINNMLSVQNACHNVENICFLIKKKVDNILLKNNLKKKSI